MDSEAATRLIAALKLAFHDEQALAPDALRAFLQEGRGWEQVNPELPAGPHTWREMLEAVSATLIRFRLVDDALFDRLVLRSPASAEIVERVRSELLHPERHPAAWRLVGPSGGTVERIEVDPHNPRRLLSCVHLHFKGGMKPRIGLFRSLDRGATWRELSPEGAPDVLVRWIAFDPHRPGQVRMGTDDGLWRSDDHGDTWTRDHDTAAHVPVWQVRFHPYHEDACLIGAGTDWSTGGVTFTAATGFSAAATGVGEQIQVERVVGRRPNWFQFFDKAGGMWTSIDLGTPQRAAAFAPRDWRKAWIAAGRRLVRSDDACRTFRQMGATGERHVWDIAVDPEDSDRVLVGTDDGVYCSSDGGLTFQRTCESANVRQFAWAAGVLLAGAATGPLRSRDRGMTWEPLGLGFPEQRCWALTRASDGTVYAGPEGAGVYRLDTGSDVWVPRTAGLLPLPSQRPALASPSNWAAVNEFGVNITHDEGHTWRRVGRGGLSVAAGDAGLVQLAVQSGPRGEIRLTRDAGKSWSETTPVDQGVYWIRIHEGGVWARGNRGWLGRLEADFKWTNDNPPAGADNRHLLADVLVLTGGAWVAISVVDGTLFRRRSAVAPWRMVRDNPAALRWGSGTWRLARTRVGWFAWRYEGGLADARRLGAAWSEIPLPHEVTAIGGVCSDPGGAPAAWIASLQGELFRVTRGERGWNWEHRAERWSTGGCGFLDCVQSPPALIGAGPGGLYRFDIRA